MAKPSPTARACAAIASRGVAVALYNKYDCRSDHPSLPDSKQARLNFSENCNGKVKGKQRIKRRQTEKENPRKLLWKASWPNGMSESSGTTKSDRSTSSGSDRIGGGSITPCQRYQSLIIATGCLAIRLAESSVQGADAKNIFYLREIDDADKLVEAIQEKKNGKAVIITSSYCGLKWFNSVIAASYHSYYKSKGIKIFESAHAVRFIVDSSGEVKEVKLNDGTMLEANIVIVDVGIKVNTSLLKGQFEEELGRIKTDALFRTSVPDVYAAGDVNTFCSNLYNRCSVHGKLVEHARKSTKHAVTAIKAIEENKTIDEYDYLPYFYSRSFDLSWHSYGLFSDKLVMFGEMDHVSPSIILEHTGSKMGTLLELSLRMGLMKKTRPWPKLPGSVD
ncbi:monodehydroascorbate reductase, seedling isozyme-like [Pistacia vera]|uniref:monodehydroascorbate reductase, seedling isozyme-like n=1 Tax=Pistacia vera TaxID=55513 RepID=UPI00126358A9|nr:monodehydroascorbate reductase, seedling isozyme-like [Pistacia vera]